MKKNPIVIPFKDLKVGMLVTCKQALSAFYSTYTGLPECFFTPGMVAIIRQVLPGKAGSLGWPSRVCADFYVENLPQTPLTYEEIHAHPHSPWRVSIDAANITVIDPEPANPTQPLPVNTVDILAGSLWNSILWNQREQKGWTLDFKDWPRRE